jgi:hypothetical protein
LTYYSGILPFIAIAEYSTHFTQKWNKF